ncbi:phasin family protein [Thiotrichales bacterium 19S11-10]|nr:phasin family protein [Thiotrichales bacterium 19S11-10]
MNTSDYFKTFSNFGEKWVELAKNFYEPVTELQKITTDAIERTAKAQIETTTELFSTTTEKAKKLAGIKKLEDFTSFYQDASKEVNDKALAYTKSSIDNALKTSTEFNKWVEKGFEQFKKQATKP